MRAQLLRDRPERRDDQDADAAGPKAMLPPVEAARRLGVTRSGIHALVQQAELDDVVVQAQGHRRERRTTSGRQHESIRPLGTSQNSSTFAGVPAILALTHSRYCYRGCHLYRR